MHSLSLVLLVGVLAFVLCDPCDQALVKDCIGHHFWNVPKSYQGLYRTACQKHNVCYDCVSIM